MRLGTICVPVAVAVCFVLPGPASAHTDLQSSDPEDGDRLTKPPRVVSLTLSEPPAQGSSVKVTDGCKRQVVRSSGPDPDTEAVLIADVGPGEPGDWKVTFRSISAVDGHLVRGTLSFTVAGKKDCSRDRGDGGDDDDQVAGGEDTRVDNPDDDDGGSFPIVPFAIGSGVVVIGAFALRRAAAK